MRLPLIGSARKVDRLFSEGCVKVAPTTMVRWKRDEHYLDLVAMVRDEVVGYATAYAFGKSYQLVGDPHFLTHPGFSNEQGVGFEVIPQQENRGLGSLLVQIVTGLAQRVNGMRAPFLFEAHAVQNPRLFRRLGFDVSYANGIANARYDHPTRLPGLEPRTATSIEDYLPDVFRAMYATAIGHKGKEAAH